MTALSRPLVGPAAASGSARGGLGELFQGPGPGHERDHIAIVTLPVDLFSHATLLPDDGVADRLPTQKRQALAERFWSHQKLEPPRGRWAFTSQVPVGKGMASSSADLAALVHALEAAHGVQLTCAEISQLIGPIERSDPTFIDAPTLYLSGGKRELLRSTARMRFYASFTAGSGKVDTESMPEEQLLACYHRHTHIYEELVRSMIAAIVRGDRQQVAADSTRSAELHQSVLAHPLYESVRAAHRELGALGVVLAHTGTAIGLLFDRVPDPVHCGELSAFWRGLGIVDDTTMAGW